MLPFPRPTAVCSRSVSSHLPAVGPCLHPLAGLEGEGRGRSPLTSSRGKKKGPGSVGSEGKSRSPDLRPAAGAGAAAGPGASSGVGVSASASALLSAATSLESASMVLPPAAKGERCQGASVHIGVFGSVLGSHSTALIGGGCLGDMGACVCGVFHRRGFSLDSATGQVRRQWHTPLASCLCVPPPQTLLCRLSCLPLHFLGALPRWWG